MKDWHREAIAVISDSPRLFHDANLSSGTADNHAVCLELKGQGRRHLLDARGLRALRWHCITHRHDSVIDITKWVQEYFQNSALSSKASIVDGMEVHKCIQYGQLACFGRHYECWKVYKGFRATYAPLQTMSISGKALCISAGQCKTTYCSYYNMAS